MKRLTKLTIPAKEGGRVYILDSLSRKTTRLRSGELRRGRQFRAPGGPPFAKASSRQAVQAGKRPVFAKATPDRQVVSEADKSCRRTTRLRRFRRLWRNRDIFVKLFSPNFRFIDCCPGDWIGKLKNVFLDGSKVCFLADGLVRIEILRN
jgi:hypothetical protein